MSLPWRESVCPCVCVCGASGPVFAREWHSLKKPQQFQDAAHSLSHLRAATFAHHRERERREWGRGRCSLFFLEGGGCALGGLGPLTSMLRPCCPVPQLPPAVDPVSSHLQIAQLLCNTPPPPPPLTLSALQSGLPPAPAPPAPPAASPFHRSVKCTTCSKAEEAEAALLRSPLSGEPFSFEQNPRRMMRRKLGNFPPHLSVPRWSDTLPPPPHRSLIIPAII